MPELPEVETTRRGISPWLTGQKIQSVRVRQPSLRWPVPAEIADCLRGARVSSVKRRSKYLLIEVGEGTALVHLGMSGSLRLSDPAESYRKHDHWWWTLENGKQLRYHDPRRFGALLWMPSSQAGHPLLQSLGPEPLESEFTGAYLWQQSRARKVAIKNFIMDSRVVVGVGNIYASESLFRAGIHPLRAAGRVSLQRYQGLADAIRQVLGESIESGGSTLRDYVNSSGAPGYFQQQLGVYGRQGQPCPACGEAVRSVRIGQRSSFYCPRCQR